MGINLNSTTFTVAPPTASGQAITWLVEAAFAEQDTTPIVLPYYNAANPAQPYSGPSNNGNAQPTQRLETVALQCKPGAPAPAGSQVAPPVDQGWVGLWLITLEYGQTTVTAANITVVPGAPFLPFQLPQLTAGFSRQSVITLSGGWTVPRGVTQVRVRVIGGGGGGGGGSSSFSGGGGGAGGFAQAVAQVAPGTVVPVTIGQGGAGGQPGQTGSSGGSSTFGGVLGATGGGGGGSNNPFSQGGAGGVGTGGRLHPEPAHAIRRLRHGRLHGHDGAGGRGRRFGHGWGRGAVPRAAGPRRTARRRDRAAAGPMAARSRAGKGPTAWSSWSIRSWQPRRSISSCRAASALSCWMGRCRVRAARRPAFRASRSCRPGQRRIRQTCSTTPSTSRPALCGNPGDAVATLDVAITPSNPGDLSLASAAADGLRCVLWLQAGQPGTVYTVTLKIGTQNGRVLARSVLLPVIALANSVVPADSLLTDTGAPLVDSLGEPIETGS